MRPITDWRVHFLRCFIVTTSIAFCAILVRDCWFAYSRDWDRYVGGIALSSMSFLLLFSSLCFRRYRRTAAIGLAVAAATLILGFLSPEL
jgi:hypothetical protein